MTTKKFSRTDAILKPANIPFDDSKWIIVLNGDLFGRYMTKTQARNDAKEYNLRLTEA